MNASMHGATQTLYTHRQVSVVSVVNGRIKRASLMRAEPVHQNSERALGRSWMKVASMRMRMNYYC